MKKTLLQLQERKMTKKTKNKLAVVVPFYKRERVTTICFKRLAKQAVKHGFDVIACGSEGDKSKSFAESFGFIYIEKENTPVSKKFQALIDECNFRGYSGVIVVGSDDLILDSLFESYKSVSLTKKAVYGVDDVVFYRTSDSSVKTKGAYNQNKMLLGVGRLYTKPLLKSINYQLFDKEINSGIDTLAWNKVKNFAHKIELENVVLDIKHELNITNHSIIESCKVDLGLRFIEENFPAEYQSLIELSSVEVSDRNIQNPRLTKNKILPPLNKRAFAVEFIVDVLNFKVGDVKKGLTYATAIQLVRSKKAKIINGNSN